MQIASAFSNVQSSLSWFIDNYRPFAEWKSSVDRLTNFHEAICKAQPKADELAGLRVCGEDCPELSIDNLRLRLPDGRVLLNDLTMTVSAGDTLLVRGPSGVGKSTLFRAIAGIWPYGSGTIGVHKSARKLSLPQKPYLPIGTLRDAISYPEKPGTFCDSDIEKALESCRLQDFVCRMNESAHWEQVMSPGEQQRLAFARALLYKPEWLFLDEATSALDDATQDYLYCMIGKLLPDTSIVSIAHREDLKHFHRKVLSLDFDGSHQLAALAYPKL